ncbi:MAG: tRNA 4-thiouridine(8) synthase ThiI [Candidatus Alkanophagales archaeon]|nr:MAG: tRNA 4-thiouridine(8) synthase ThiI [Candidatus Alkanophagales archaeon]
MYLVRYSEVFLKSEPVRRHWESALVKNIKRAVGDCKIRTDRGRIWVEGVINPEKLKKVFGVVSFSECEHCKLDELEKLVIEFCKKAKIEHARTFAVRVKRVGTHDFTSQQKAAELGALILKEFPRLKVDLKKPEKEIFVEIRDDDCYIFDKVIQGVGGIPLGAQGRLVALFSGGIDSPVAAWLMMKRGCEIIPVYLDNSPFTDHTTLKRVESVAEVLRGCQPDFELRVIPHGDFLLRAKEVLSRRKMENYTCILCKRQMYRTAEAVAREEGAKGVVTGESLGQVASQTLENLLVLDEACSLPVYRPLIGFDKLETERIAREIGTYERSILPAKSCEAVPKKPTTKAKLEKVLEVEAELGEEYGC